jgi:hypothetical protein
VVWHQLPVSFVLTEESVLRVKNPVAELGNKLFKETATINTLFLLAMLVYKLNLEFLF